MRQERRRGRRAAGRVGVFLREGSSLRRRKRFYAKLPLNVRGGNLRKPPGHNTRNTRCAGMCQMQHPQNTLSRRTVYTGHDVYMHRHDVYENVGERAAAIPRGDCRIREIYRALRRNRT